MIVYKTTCLINGMQYIGKLVSNDPNYLGSGIHLKNAIRKYGKSNFVREILEVCENKDQLSEREQYWINKLNAVNSPNFYNISSGGDGGDTYTANPNKERIAKQNGDKVRGRIWINDPLTNKRKFVKPSDLDALLLAGWVKGNPSASLNFNSSDRKFVHNPLTGQIKLVKSNKVQDFINLGWKHSRPSKVANP